MLCAVSALVYDTLHDPAKVELAATHLYIATLNQRRCSAPTERKTELLVELPKDPNIFTAITFMRTNRA